MSHRFIAYVPYLTRTQEGLMMMEEAYVSYSKAIEKTKGRQPTSIAMNGRCFMIMSLVCYGL